jgi:hypothetical protein
MVDHYIKFSASGHCGEIGFHGEMCKECYLGLHIEPVTEKGIADADIGQCPNCGDVGFGMLGSTCVACEDTGMTYKSVDDDSLYPMDDDKEEEEYEDEKEVNNTFPVGLDCTWTEKIVAVVNSQYNAVFGEITELMQKEVRHTSYAAKLFLCSMGGYLYPCESKEWIKQNFVHKYVFSLVALGVTMRLTPCVR